MHEQALMNDLMRKIEGVAAEQGGARVTRVRVWLGALSHMTPAHFREHFAESSRGTLAEAAELEIEASHDTSLPEAQQIRLKSLDLA